MNKNYYKVLEITENASEEEIKKAYRKLSKRFHPDVNPGDSQAEARFQEISEAYAVLGNTEKRKAYDSSRLEQTHKKQKKYGGQNKMKNERKSENPIDVSDLFEKYMGRGWKM